MCTVDKICVFLLKSPVLTWSNQHKGILNEEITESWEGQQAPTERAQVTHLNGSYWHQQALQLGVSSGWRKPFNRHNAGLRLALHHPEILLVRHQAAPAHRTCHSPASPVHDDLATTKGTIQGWSLGFFFTATKIQKWTNQNPLKYTVSERTFCSFYPLSEKGLMSK